MTRRLAGLLTFTLLLAGCGYFNALYNANRRFADARRAETRGDRVAAARAYRESIEKAAVSYRRYPNSRWADDALLLIGRARFSLHEDREAAAAMRALLKQSSDPDVRRAAHAYLGGALVRMDQPEPARPHLDSALIGGTATDAAALARLWRARLRFLDGTPTAAWQDLEHAAQNRHTAFDAGIEGARRAAEARDSTRFAAFLAHLGQARFTASSLQPVETLLRAQAAAWSPGTVLHASAPLERAAWTPELLDQLALVRADIAAAAGDTAAAIALYMKVVSAVNGGIGSQARLAVARLRLAAMTEPAGLEPIRVLLVRAYDVPEALALQRTVKAAQILVRDADSPEHALSLFAAAELARDDLAAPLLARRLFLDYVQLAPGSEWAGKALLAAHLVHADTVTHAALAARSADPYVRAARGAEHVADAVQRAEERLARGLVGVRADALLEAASRDVIVARALSELDSTRAAARSDSLRIVCGTLLDTLRLTGVRADSTRSACMRSDSARIAFVLTADTTLLHDTVIVDPRELGEGRTTTRPDTTFLR